MWIVKPTRQVWRKLTICHVRVIYNTVDEMRVGAVICSTEYARTQWQGAILKTVSATVIRRCRQAFTLQLIYTRNEVLVAITRHSCTNIFQLHMLLSMSRYLALHPRFCELFSERNQKKCGINNLLYQWCRSTDDSCIGRMIEHRVVVNYLDDVDDECRWRAELRLDVTKNRAVCDVILK